MKLFSDNGHLTDEGLDALINESLDEMGRLEAAEHIGFCDECLDRYTGMLTGDVLISPPQPLETPVLRKLRSKKIHLGWMRYATVAAAAVLAVLMTGAGTMLTKYLPNAEAPQAPKSTTSDLPQETGGFMARLNDSLNSAANKVNQVFDLEPDTMDALQQVPAPNYIKPDEAPVNAPKDKEALFSKRIPDNAGDKDSDDMGEDKQPNSALEDK